MVHEIVFNIGHNLFKPLLLFFMLGLLVPTLKINLEFPKALYQSLSLYLLLAIGWHGGEELAQLSAAQFHEAVLVIALGMICNTAIGFIAYQLLKRVCAVNPMDAGTIAGYYGSDSAGTFVTCIGVLAGIHLVYAPYAPVMLAAMEIPGCLVALFLASHNRKRENSYVPNHLSHAATHASAIPNVALANFASMESQNPTAMAISVADPTQEIADSTIDAIEASGSFVRRQVGRIDWKLLHEVFFNPSIFLLFGGIAVGFIGRRQGIDVVQADDELMIKMFQGALCFFLFEMGITAAQRLRDIRQAGWKLVVFALIAPNVFALCGMAALTAFSVSAGHDYGLGTTVIFGVLCGSASYIAVPAVQRMAIPEASPSLPLIASLGVTFTYNVTIGIPVYVALAKPLRSWIGV